MPPNIIDKHFVYIQRGHFTESKHNYLDGQDTFRNWAPFTNGYSLYDLT